MKNPSLVIALLFAVCLTSVRSVPDWTKLNSMIEEAIAQGVFPSASIGIGSAKNVIYNKAWGTLQVRRDIFSMNATTDTRYDLDRLSPAVSLVPTYMHLIDNLRVSLTDHVSKYQFDFDNNGKKNISIENMMLHNSGFEASYPGALPKTAEEVLRHINSAKLNYTVGNKTLYSDEGLIVLHEVIQKITGKLLEEYVFQVNVQIGMRNTNYAPTYDLYKVAPTAVVNGKGLLYGKAFDPMSYLFNTTAGHAGIFSNSIDTLRFFRMMLAGGQLDGQPRYFLKATVDQFTSKPTNLKYNNSRAYIFDTYPDPDTNPPVGSKITPEKNFGLYGDTGCLAWADKTKDVAIVILTNAMHPTGTSKVRDLMPKLVDEIMTQLGF